jgi:predicted XRE-type DNA-binding protein
MTGIEKGSIGSSFDEFLEEEGITDEVSEMALKKVISASIRSKMEELHLSQADMARRMQTSRAQMSRLLDPENPGVTLNTIQRAAKVLGMRVRLELI